VEQRPDVVDQSRMVAGEQLERDERRSSAGRALVLESSPQELGLLPEPELADRPIPNSTLAVVGGPNRGLDLVLPARSQLRELTLRALSGELVRLSSG
jgi:hypothetical protein